MKILMISHSSELGGAERSMIDLLEDWQKQDENLEYHFVVKGPVKTMGKVLADKGWGYTPIVYSAWSRRIPLTRSSDIFRNALFDTRAVFEIEKVINTFKPDVIMTNTIVAPWGAFAAKLKGIPHVWFVREFGDLDHGHTIEVGREEMFSDISYFSNLVVTNSKTLQKHVTQYIPKEKTTVVYTPFDIEYMDKKSKEKITNPFKHKDSIKLVITGRIAPSKGQAEAAQAVGKLVKKGKNVELCIVGSKFLPDDDADLMAIIDKYDISSRVHLVGQQGNPLPFVKYADIGLMASRMEAFGRTTFEYFVMGKPVIGANGGATPEIVHDDRNGFLYKPGSIKELTDRIEKYVNNPELIKKHSINARATAEKMMSGEYNSVALLRLIKKVAAIKQVEKLPNSAKVWLGYPALANNYIQDSGADSLRKIVYIKLRQKAKVVLVKVQKLIKK